MSDMTEKNAQRDAEWGGRGGVVVVDGFVLLAM